MINFFLLLFCKVCRWWLTYLDWSFWTLLLLLRLIILLSSTSFLGIFLLWRWVIVKNTSCLFEANTTHKISGCCAIELFASWAKSSLIGVYNWHSLSSWLLLFSLFSRCSLDWLGVRLLLILLLILVRLVITISIIILLLIWFHS